MHSQAGIWTMDETVQVRSDKISQNTSESYSEADVIHS